MLDTHDYLPEVSFSLDCGSRGVTVDFDYDLYLQTILDMGGSVEDYHNSQILVDLDRAKVKSTFQPDSGLITVTNFSRPNVDLVHETQHYLDHTSEPLSPYRIIAANVSIRGLVFVLVADALQLTATYIPSDVSNRVAEAVLPYNLGATVIAVASCLVFYEFSRYERDAKRATREFGRLNIIQVVSNQN